MKTTFKIVASLLLCVLQGEPICVSNKISNMQCSVSLLIPSYTLETLMVVYSWIIVTLLNFTEAIVIGLLMVICL